MHDRRPVRENGLRNRYLRTGLLAALLALTMAVSVRAETALVAVASNFTTIAEEIAQAFEASGPHSVRLSGGSTGKIYAQIVRGAPFDIFLSADAARPERLVEEGFAAQDHAMTYAVGRLVFWARDGQASEALLTSGMIPRIAIANPDLAPYGLAAIQALGHFGVTADLVRGENVAQAIAMAATGNVAHALVPLSATIAGVPEGGTTWTIPGSAHDPIRQDALLLDRALGNSAAVAFFAFLRSKTARAIIARSGYEPG